MRVKIFGRTLLSREIPTKEISTQKMAFQNKKISSKIAGLSAFLLVLHNPMWYNIFSCNSD